MCASGDADLPAVLRDAPWDDELVDPEEAAGDREAWENLRADRQRDETVRSHRCATCRSFRYTLC
jgi:hypothetical protein